MFADAAAVVYLAGVFTLMVFMYLIARFYRIKLDPATPVVGFPAAMFAIVTAVTGILIGNNGTAEKIFVDTSLFIAGLAGAWNSIALYVRMKRVHK